MNEVANSPEPQNFPVSPQAKNIKLIYILYLVNIVVPFCGLVGVVMAYINKDEAPEWLQSHFQFAIRTFWISLLFAIISLILTVVIVGFLMLLGLLVWIIIRCVKAMNLVDRGLPHPNPTGWWF